uniref:Uncharacterized protein n=1 Tax=Lotharella oceanica TaxID=641309 RepID=A0A140GYP6_9EUKA|nr:hypothetical protein AN617_3 [Lotharella oceanica]AMN87068.1 hypothetical protein AN617_3 [Lotharella oceanica]
MADPFCDKDTLDELVSYFEKRVGEEAPVQALPSIKFIGTPRVPEGTSFSELHECMIAGHGEFFSANRFAEVAASDGSVLGTTSHTGDAPQPKNLLCI